MKIWRRLSKIENNFCLENGINPKLALGKPWDNFFSFRVDPIFIEKFTAYDQQKLVLEQINTLFIDGSARFANGVIKLTNALLFAKEVNSRYLRILIFQPIHSK
jgi:hypothetical protein